MNGIGSWWIHLARIDINLGEEFMKKLSLLGSKVAEISEKAVLAGAEPVKAEMDRELHKVLSGDSSGELEISLGISPVRTDKKGVINAKIGYAGYDRHRKKTAKFPNGIPNALKARALDSGTSTERKRPYVRNAIKKSKELSLTKMNETVDNEIKKIMKE